MVPQRSLPFPSRIIGSVLVLVVGFGSIAWSVPIIDDPPQPKDGPLPWTVPAFLKDRWSDGTLGWVSEDFTPWDALKGRDGNYYEHFRGAALTPGGAVFALSPEGTARPVYRFKVPFMVSGGVRLGRRLTAYCPLGRAGVGQDGAIYGRVITGGVFNFGLIYKVDAQGRYQPLHHLEKLGVEGDVLVAASGDVYAALSTDSSWVSEPTWLLRLSKDGRYRYIPGVLNQTTMAMAETANHEIVIATVGLSTLPRNGLLWRLNASDELEMLAEVGSVPHVLLPLVNGNLVCATDTRIVEVTPVGEVSELHVFGSGEGSSPDFLTLAQDGSYLGSTSQGGLHNGGTWFRIAPGTNDFTVLGHLPAKTGGSLNVATWMAEVFPLRVAAEKGNLLPVAKDDVVAAATVRAIGGGLPKRVIRVLTNDRDRDRDPLSIESVGEAAHGTVTLNAVTQTVTYTAQTSTVKSDRFLYTIADGKGGRATAQVIIRGNLAGRYRGEVLATNESTPGNSFGEVVVSVTPARTVSGRLLFEGKSYPFTARFNEFNQAAALPSPDPDSAVPGLQLSLRSDHNGVGSVHAILQYSRPPESNAEFVAECALVP